MKKNQFIITNANKINSKEIIALVHMVIDFSLKHIYSKYVLKWFYEFHSVLHIEEEFDSEAIILAIYEDNKIIGTATYQSHELKRLFIHPKYQMLGLGKMFVDYIEDIARIRNEKHLLLYASPATWRYYETMGYQIFSIAAEKLECGNYLSYCRMVKNLTQVKWNIYKAKENDAGGILLGQKEAFLDVGKQHNHMDIPPMTESLHEIKKAIKNTLVFVAKDKEQIIGSVRGEQKDGTCHISRLWVVPEYQSKGIGHALMFAIEDAFDHIESYELFTGSKSQETIDFYHERGYVEIKREPLRNYELIHFKKLNASDMIIIK